MESFRKWYKGSKKSCLRTKTWRSRLWRLSGSSAPRTVSTTQSTTKCRSSRLAKVSKTRTSRSSATMFSTLATRVVRPTSDPPSTMHRQWTRPWLLTCRAPRTSTQALFPTAPRQSTTRTSRGIPTSGSGAAAARRRPQRLLRRTRRCRV